MKNSIFKTGPTLPTLLIAFFCVFSGLSCAQNASGTRGAKTSSRIVRPQTSQASQQAAQVQNVNYILDSVSAPSQNSDGTYTISSEMHTPSGDYLPFSTTHTGAQDAGGTYSDANSGNTLDIRARCIGDSCNEYVLLVTVVKNGYAYHQVAAISYANDCSYYVEERNTQIEQIYSSVQDVINQNSNLQAMNDCSN